MVLVLIWISQKSSLHSSSQEGLKSEQEGHHGHHCTSLIFRFLGLKKNRFSPNLRHPKGIKGDKNELKWFNVVIVGFIVLLWFPSFKETFLLFNFCCWNQGLGNIKFLVPDSTFFFRVYDWERNNLIICKLNS